jgi:translation initiation factor 5A
MGGVKLGTVRDLKPGKYVVIDGEPCRVVNIEKGKSGKHGAAKARVDALSMFTSKKKSLLRPADANIEIPIIERKAAQIIAVLGDGRLQLMDLQTYE